jgi:hypothetical protein
MKAKLSKLLAGIVLVMLCVSAAGQNALEVHAKLRLAEARTKYRIGETIRLVLELTADREGFVADTTANTHEPPHDIISVSPAEGVNQYWSLNSTAFTRTIKSTCCG